MGTWITVALVIQASQSVHVLAHGEFNLAAEIEHIAEVAPDEVEKLVKVMIKVCASITKGSVIAHQLIVKFCASFL